LLRGILLLFLCLLGGDILAEGLHLPVPGPVMGMIIMFTGLLIRGSVPDDLELAGGGLLKYIGLLFVPAGAGISMYVGLIAAEWDVILVASVGSTILTLLSCALLFTWLYNDAEDEK